MRLKKLMNAWWTKYLPFFIRESLDGRHKLQKVIGNTGWLMFEKIVQAGVGLVVAAWTAQYLGPESFGQLSYAIAFVGLFAAISMLGFDNVGVREMVRAPEQKDILVGTCFFLMLSAGVMIFGLILGGIFIIRPHDTLTHCLVGIIAAGTPFLATGAIDFWFQSQVQSKYSIYAKTIVFLIFSAARVSLILMKAPLTAFAWLVLAEISFKSLGILLVYQMRGNEIKNLHLNIKMAANLLRDSWPLIFSTIIYLIHLRIDQIMIGEMVGNDELGMYAAAVRLAEGWWFIPIAICASVFPDIVKAGANSEELYYDRLQKLYNLLVLIAYLIAITIYFGSSSIIKLLFGAAYLKAGPVLAVLIWSGVFTSLGAARVIYLTSRNWGKLELISSLFGCILNVCLNIYLIPHYGAMGSAIATCISSWFAIHVTCFIFRPLRKTGIMLTKAIFYPKIW
ncbi:MAG: flippase [Syntrophaceae bacterium]|nr:flippase [Syntrophaceae bacterium]